MCLIVFAHRSQPDWPLVVTANRDEFHDRPTAPAALWEGQNDEPGIIAGRDLQAGGTWLGVTVTGRFAAVTNIRDPAQQEGRPRSRGELTRDFLFGMQSPEDFARALRPHFQEFAGFNLLLGDTHQLVYVNNSAGRIEALQPGLYGVSNGLLDSDWPKIRRAKAAFGTLLAERPEFNTQDLLDIMTDDQVAPAEELPNTGVSPALERTLSSIFIMNPERAYGTRCSTAVLLGTQGNGRFCEQNFNRTGSPTSRHYFEFDYAEQAITARG